MIEINDGTGTVEVTCYFDVDDIYWATTRPFIQPHSYIEIIATIRKGPDNEVSGLPGLQLSTYVFILLIFFPYILAN